MSSIRHRDNRSTSLLATEILSSFVEDKKEHLSMVWFDSSSLDHFTRFSQMLKCVFLSLCQSSVAVLQIVTNTTRTEGFPGR